MSRSRIIIVLAILVLIGLAIYFWPKTEPVPVSAPPVAQGTPSPDPQKKVELTKEGLPAPVAPGSAPQANKPYGEARLLELFMTPIAFYGKVIDEKGNPVAGATATMSVVDRPITDGAKYAKITDGDGLFSLGGVHGAAVSVDVAKGGYYSTAQSRGMIRFGKFRSNSDPQIPTPGSPTVFVLRKMGETVPLIHVTERSVRVSKNGSPIMVNLGTGLTNGQGDLRVEAWTSNEGLDPNLDQSYEWRCRLTVPGGGLVERNDHFGFEAPTEGYQEAVELTPPAEKWTSHAERQYFVKLSDNRYARITFEMRTGGEHFFVIESYLNPKPGSRNLEYDPAKKVIPSKP